MKNYVVINGLIVAVDLGGTQTTTGMLDDAGNITNLKTIQTPTSINELMEFIATEAVNCEGIAYGLAGVFDKQTSVIHQSPNAPMLNGVNLDKVHQQFSNKPFKLYNDMEAATAGIAQEFPDEEYLLACTWSSGWGGRAWKKGELVTDTMEVGHTMFDYADTAVECACHVKGHFEAIVGGAKIRDRVVNVAQELGIVIPNGVDPCYVLDQAYLRNEQWAVTIYNEVIKAMGGMLANWQSTFVAPLIVWKGTFARHALRMLEDKIRAQMQKYLINPKWADKDFLRFEIASSENVALIGANYLYRSAL